MEHQYSRKKKGGKEQRRRDKETKLRRKKISLKIRVSRSEKVI